MNPKVDKYKDAYQEIVEYSIKEHGSLEASCIISEEMFTVSQWLDDIGADFWEEDKIKTAIQELNKEKEYELIDMLIKGFKRMQNIILG